jgi:DNA-binding NarL/FixJ family response regulator
LLLSKGDHEAIEHVFQGGLHFLTGEGMTDALLAPMPGSSPDQPGSARTDRDLEIMTLLAEGLSKQSHRDQARQGLGRR